MTGYDLKLVPTLELLWQRSPTYRKQCAALAARRAIVSIRLEPGEIGSGTRAESVLGFLENGRIVVRSRLRTTGPLPELVSHELEHALEFAEGVNYRIEILRGTAHRGPGNRIETRRAHQAGRQAASEVKRWKPAKASPPPVGLQAALANP